MVALEHTLVILLLLVGLLNARPRIPQIAWWVIGSALLLVFIAPALPVPLPWDLLSALFIPLLLWQISHQLVGAQVPPNLRDIVLWLVMALGIGGILYYLSDLTMAGAFMFGVLSASIAWRAVEETSRPTILGQIGPLSLAFLLVEIAPAVEAPTRYLLALIGGAAIGAMIAYAAVRLALRIPSLLWKGIISIGQVYLGYLTAIMLNLSGVAAASLGVALFVAYGTKQGLWLEGKILPRLLDNRLVFSLALLSLGFFAWQTHVPITPILILEVSLCLLFTVVFIWISRKVHSQLFLQENTYLRIIRSVVFLLVPAILIWPRTALLEPFPLILALLFAALTAAGSLYSLNFLLNIYAWLDQPGIELEQTGQAVQGVLVRDLMDREFITISPTMSVPEIARLFSERHMECLPVVDDENTLLGIVTEHDIFLKEQKLPSTDRIYQSVFNEPISAEKLLETYESRAEMYMAADVMSTNTIWVKANSSIGQAIRLMVSYGYKCLPVLETGSQAKGKIIGLISRSNIIRLIAGSQLSSDAKS